MWKTTTALILATLILMTIGIVMLASTSGIRSLAIYDDPYFFVKRQLLWLALALLAGAFAARFDYHKWNSLALPFFIATVILLILVLIPGIGVKIGGSRRWIHLGPMGFQPSELGKFAVIVILSWWFAREQRRANEFIHGSLIPFGIMGGAVLLIFVEPDFGASFLIAMVGVTIMALGGAKITHILLFTLPGLILFSIAVMLNPVRMRRVMAFLNPELYEQTYSFQLMNAIYAFTLGGLTGVGLGQSIQKHYYLPEAHTDFIFAIIGEELGIAGSLGTLLLFAVIFTCGLKIAAGAPDMFGKLMAFGLTMMIIAQATMNIAVVTGCLPTKGLALPFISFGGSCLVMMTVAIGTLVNIGMQQPTSLAAYDIRRFKHRFDDF